jgi:hypothetical protein
MPVMHTSVRQDEAQAHFHILFDKLSLEQLLVEDDQSNFYRLAHCLQKQNPYGVGYGATLVSFFIQITLTAYVDI